MPRRKPNSVYRTREHLTRAEVDRLIDAAKANRWGHRNATMILSPSVTVCGRPSLSTCVGIKSISPTPSCTYAGPRRARLPPTPLSVMKCGPCASCSGSRIPSRRSCSPASGGRRSRRQALRAWWSALVCRGQARLSGSSSHATPRLWLCAGQQGPRYAGPASLSRATRTFSARYATPNCRPVASRSYQ